MYKLISFVSIVLSSISILMVCSYLSFNPGVSVISTLVYFVFTLKADISDSKKTKIGLFIFICMMLFWIQFRILGLKDDFVSVILFIILSVISILVLKRIYLYIAKKFKKYIYKNNKPVFIDDNSHNYYIQRQEEELFLQMKKNTEEVKQEPVIQPKEEMSLFDKINGALESFFIAIGDFTISSLNKLLNRLKNIFIRFIKFFKENESIILISILFVLIVFLIVYRFDYWPRKVKMECHSVAEGRALLKEYNRIDYYKKYYQYCLNSKGF